MTTDESVWEGAWWSAVAEPADPAARVVRSVLGDRAGREWLQAPWSGVPAALGSSTTADWPKQWNRWRERALEADPSRDLARVERAGGGFVMRSDPRWPAQLECLGEDEPLGLWFLGSLPESPACSGYVSIVGARASTSAGGRCARNMAYQLARAGYGVVSGGAIGIDIEAHRGAMAGDGATVCVLAGGVLNPYPACHTEDFRQMVAGRGQPADRRVERRNHRRRGRGSLRRPGDGQVGHELRA